MAVHDFVLAHTLTEAASATHQAAEMAEGCYRGLATPAQSLAISTLAQAYVMIAGAIKILEDAEAD